MIQLQISCLLTLFKIVVCSLLNINIAVSESGARDTYVLSYRNVSKKSKIWEVMNLSVPIY